MLAGELNVMCPKQKQYIFGVILALFHTCLLLYTFYYVNAIEAGTAQIQLVWVFWLIIDFPISIFMILHLFLGGYVEVFSILLIHGLIGTIWWFLLPTLVVKILRKLKVLKA